MGVLVKTFNKAIKKPKREHKEGRPPKIKPSMLGSPCYRKVYYSYNRVEEETGFTLGSSRILDSGSALGDMIYETFRKSGTAIDYVDENGNIPIVFGKPNPEFKVESSALDIQEGYIDLVAIIEGKLWLGEFKTINSFGYAKVNEPKPEHKIQGILYLYLFNKMLREGKFKHIKQLDGFEKAEGISFLYFNRDSCTPKDYEITTGDHIFKQIVTKIQTIKGYTSRQELPPKTPHFCNNCPYLEKCTKNLHK